MLFAAMYKQHPQHIRQTLMLVYDIYTDLFNVMFIVVSVVLIIVNYSFTFEYLPEELQSEKCVVFVLVYGACHAVHN